MMIIASFIVTFLTNVIFFRWYTAEIAKEMKKIEERVDRKLLFFGGKNQRAK